MQIAMNRENVCLGKHCHWNVSIFTQHPQLSLQQYSFYILGQAATAALLCGAAAVWRYLYWRGTQKPTLILESLVTTLNWEPPHSKNCEGADMVDANINKLLTDHVNSHNVKSLPASPMHVVLWRRWWEHLHRESLYFKFAWFNILTLTFDL